ncbi:MAG: SlyX family protein [Succinatimonas sp.]|nr:SlyX family protein [Succinatimonas sp.]
MSAEERITALEEKNAWLEDEVERLGIELSATMTQIEQLKLQFKFLYSKVGDPYAVRPQNEEVPPPHY